MTMFLALLALLGPASSPSCDASLWTHVYKPARLHVLQRCVAVTGTIVDATAGKRKDGVRHESDGDTHGWLRVDPEFRSLLDVGNRTHEGGNLVFEAVCQFPVSQADARAACRGYRSRLTIPPVGTRVAITGVYVEDGNHAHWRELHPVTCIERLPPPPSAVIHTGELR